MDPSAFDTLARAFARPGHPPPAAAPRRRLPLGGALRPVEDEAASRATPRAAASAYPAAQPQAAQPPAAQQDTTSNNQHNKHHQHHNTSTTTTVAAVGAAIPDPAPRMARPAPDLASVARSNCFNFVCAATGQHLRRRAAAPRRARPPRSAAARWTAVVSRRPTSATTRGCVVPPTVPGGSAARMAVATRKCGHEPGTCGSCATGQTCDAKSGQCQGQPTCSAADLSQWAVVTRTGTARPGNTEQACGTDGNPCMACQGAATCESGLCLTCTATNRPNGCCDAQGQCQPGQGSCFGPGGTCCAGCCDERVLSAGDGQRRMRRERRGLRVVPDGRGGRRCVERPLRLRCRHLSVWLLRAWAGPARAVHHGRSALLRRRRWRAMPHLSGRHELQRPGAVRLLAELSAVSDLQCRDRTVPAAGLPAASRSVSCRGDLRPGNGRVLLPDGSQRHPLHRWQPFVYQRSVLHRRPRGGPRRLLPE